MCFIHFLYSIELLNLTAFLNGNISERYELKMHKNMFVIIV